MEAPTMFGDLRTRHPLPTLDTVRAMIDVGNLSPIEFLRQRGLGDVVFGGVILEVRDKGLLMDLAVCREGLFKVSRILKNWGIPYYKSEGSCLEVHSDSYQTSWLIELRLIYVTEYASCLDAAKGAIFAKDQSVYQWFESNIFRLSTRINAAHNMAQDEAENM
ncbi:uncharacterized protein KD926_008966 [Aspergillus affinis]|uniref:uncharacterized protein n=1 Tax=Aspergillus affinis TaxID=1070780 RepID=UPI0022FED64B|nr:uncharacterized protein KD926_008966 [Aspergillus affinis]KAI9039865.1 hypothetical protein KD926_008966 [Aspergillus affinis]